MKQRKQRHIHLAAPAAFAFALAACGGGNGESEATSLEADSTTVVRVVTSVLEPREFEDWGVYSAELRGVDDAVLTGPAPGGGRVDAISATGTEASKGEALCDIDSELYGARLKQAQAAVELAGGDLDRARDNVKEGFVGKAALDRAELDYQNALASRIQARRAHADSRCEAPFAGVLVSRFVELHQAAAAGEPTVRVANLSRLEALVSIPEAEAAAYREGQRARFTAINGRNGGPPSFGRISSLDLAVESRNRVVRARVQLDNRAGALRPGMIGRVGILRRVHEDALVVASPTVLRLQEGTAVMAVRDSLARQVPVTLGPSRGDSVVVLSGLAAGDRVITTGAFQVSDGTRVEY